MELSHKCELLTDGRVRRQRWGVSLDSIGAATPTNQAARQSGAGKASTKLPTNHNRTIQQIWQNQKTEYGRNIS